MLVAVVVVDPELAAISSALLASAKYERGSVSAKHEARPAE
jgi:hypothetical protein